ncbi:MAG: hypothetical protein JAY72_07110, partial [Candidatus Thiodiazotropha endolucinida]|nr:hypothetical protein [Candidatus Thiodiazotropha taylori]MCW4321431.1 hypothetical protein [Candidatus Thiodiazotropha taylori]
SGKSKKSDEEEQRIPSTLVTRPLQRLCLVKPQVVIVVEVEKARLKGGKALLLYFLGIDQKFHFITPSSSAKKALTPLFRARGL